MPARASRRRLSAVLALRMRLAVIFAVCVSAANAFAAENLEYQVKATFLFKFGAYVEWPEERFADAGTPIRIGIVGADELAEFLEEIVATRTVNARPVIVERLAADTPVADVHILFVGRGAAEHLDNLLRSVQFTPTLVVTEMDDSLEAGSIINFVIADNKVRFDIGLDSAEQSHLKISSRLLSVARRVLTGNS